MTKICTCRMCRRAIRERIEWLFVLHPRWMGEFTIRFHAGLGWVPLRFYRHILGRMVQLGIVIKSVPDSPDEMPRYLLARVTVPAPARAEGMEGGRR